MEKLLGRSTHFIMGRKAKMTAQRVARLTTKAFLRLIEIEKGKCTEDLMEVRGRRWKLKEAMREGYIVTVATFGGRKQMRRHTSRRTERRNCRV